jgi:predicted metal-binding protein
MENSQKYVAKALRCGQPTPSFLKSTISALTAGHYSNACTAAGLGRNHTCPSRPGNVSLDEYRRMLSLYSWGLIIHTNDKKLSQYISFEIEAEASATAIILPFLLSDCGLCATCSAASGEPAANVKKARPAFHSVGIDVFKTVRAFGLPIETLSDPSKEEQNWYSAVFIE